MCLTQGKRRCPCVLDFLVKNAWHKLHLNGSLDWDPGNVNDFDTKSQGQRRYFSLESPYFPSEWTVLKKKTKSFLFLKGHHCTLTVASSRNSIVRVSHWPPAWCLEGTRWHDLWSHSKKRDSHFFPRISDQQCCRVRSQNSLWPYKGPCLLRDWHRWGMFSSAGQRETSGKDKGVPPNLRWCGSYPGKVIQIPIHLSLPHLL